MLIGTSYASVKKGISFASLLLLASYLSSSTVEAMLPPDFLDTPGLKRIRSQDEFTEQNKRQKVDLEQFLDDITPDAVTTKGCLLPLNNEFGQNMDNVNEHVARNPLVLSDSQFKKVREIYSILKIRRDANKTAEKEDSAIVTDLNFKKDRNPFCSLKTIDLVAGNEAENNPENLPQELPTILQFPIQRQAPALCDSSYIGKCSGYYMPIYYPWLNNIPPLMHRGKIEKMPMMTVDLYCNQIANHSNNLIKNCFELFCYIKDTENHPQELLNNSNDLNKIDSDITKIKLISLMNTTCNDLVSIRHILESMISSVFTIRAYKPPDTKINSIAELQKLNMELKEKSLQCRKTNSLHHIISCISSIYNIETVMKKLKQYY